MKQLVSIGLLLFMGCTAKNSSVVFSEYINDPKNKITQKITIGDIQTTVKWLPIQYREMNNPVRSAGTFANMEDEFYYFDVRFDRMNQNKLAKEKLLYLEFDMQHDFLLMAGSDTLLPAICQKIENGISGRSQYLVAFEKPALLNSAVDFTLLYADKIFGTGLQAFVFKAEDVRRIPSPEKNSQ